MYDCEHERVKGRVIFDPIEYKTLHPDMSDVDDAVLGTYFSAACLLLDNTERSVVRDVCERKELLFMLVTHVAELAKRGNGMVGPLTSASEGKVSVGVSALTNANWYNQTQWGAMYWAATANYRRGVRWYAGR